MEQLQIPMTSVELASEYVISTYEAYLRTMYFIEPTKYALMVININNIRFTNFRYISNVFELETLYEKACKTDEVTATIMEAVILKLYTCHGNINYVIEQISNVLANNKSTYDTDDERQKPQLKWKELLTNEPWLLVCLLLKIGRPIMSVPTLPEEPEGNDEPE